MTWNHRVMKRVCKSAGGHQETLYGIYEVYYKDDKPWLYSSDPVSPIGNTIEELRESLAHMLRATYNPVFKSSEVKKRKL